jgi:ABC-2 type transport system ATP-binding protein
MRTSPSPAIEAHELSKAFGPIQAVDGVDLELEAGRIYGLLGPNGSGKTTLIRLLTGLARPTAGSATLLGTRMPDRAVLARVGYMTQGDGIYADLSVLENVRFYGAMYGVRDEGQLRDALRVVELDEREATPAELLSGGMRRRLSLACALVHRPQVLFLDEPTVGVDPVLRMQFWAHFRGLAASGTTLVVSSHVMDEADRCDELLLLRSGRVLARGTPAGLREEAGTPDLEQIFLRDSRTERVAR